MRSWKTSKYTKVVGVSEESYDFLVKNKYKKSIAGFLDIIINYYKNEQTNHNK